MLCKLHLCMVTLYLEKKKGVQNETKQVQAASHSTQCHTVTVCGMIPRLLRNAE